MEYIFALFFFISGIITKDTTLYIVAALFCIADNIDSFRKNWLKHQK